MAVRLWVGLGLGLWHCVGVKLRGDGVIETVACCEGVGLGENDEVAESDGVALGVIDELWDPEDDSEPDTDADCESETREGLWLGVMDDDADIEALARMPAPPYSQCALVAPGQVAPTAINPLLLAAMATDMPRL